MTDLAIDTSMRACCVAVGENYSVKETQREQVKRLIPMIESTMKSAGIGFGDISRIIVSVGPGSFTGVRVGIATARGLALALDVPIIGISTLDILGIEKKKTLSQEEQNLLLNGQFGIPDPRKMLELAKDASRHLAPNPIYLKDADVSRPKKASRRLV